ncbi:MAG TPA: hypothetical protein VFU64_08645 [Gaiellaceae bacterium]|nr:hypothetical protein [Gaiellaceae bacterium]
MELPRVWTDLCWCTWCEDYVWHVEVSDEAERDAYVPRCPDCGGRLLVVAPHPRDDE